MNHSGSGLPQKVEKWTVEEVHLWLTTQVKVHHRYADKFREEEVNGESLVVYEKKDVLDMGIKHGPAVKIMYFLELLKSGSKHESQCPAYVEKWTKEQVYQWLVHVNLYCAERLQEEEVSGDCLVCFSKQDLMYLGVKSGPAVRILKTELRKLDKTNEPPLQTSSEPAVSPKHVERQPDPSASELVPVSTEEPVKVEDRPQPPKQQVSQKKEAKPHAAKPSQVNVNMPWKTVLLQSTLEDLGKDEIEKFIFSLRLSDVPGYPFIKRSHVEDKSIVQLVDLMTTHYGMDTALDVTIRVLDKIPRADLASNLKKDIDRLQVPLTTKGVSRREAEHGEKLKNLLTCGGNSLDYYKQFVVVVNKSQVEQREHLQFLSKLEKLFCVLDFDPWSAQEGVCCSYRSLRAANLHTPPLFQGEANAVIKDLNLYKQTSWVFCNGRHDIESETDKELDYKNWLIRKRKDVENLVSFIWKPEVLPNVKKTLVIFLLLSPIHGDKDPVLDTFLSFYSREANIVSICASQEIFENWKEVVLNRYECDITRGSVYELNLGQINGKVMELGPHNQLSGRLLPSSDSSAVVLTKRDEDYMPALDILCQNECENVYDENSDEFKALKIKVEEKFYRGSKVKWWNFYFCEKLRAKPFIKRDKYDNLMKLIKTQVYSSNPKGTCISINLFHDPGCGATSLAMHVMWDLRREFRCAILKVGSSEPVEVAYQVKKLAKCGKSEKPTRVLHLVDDSKEENTQSIVNCIRKTIEEEYSCRTVQDFPDAPQVIILSCIRSPYPQMQYKDCPTPCQFITAKLTKKEQEDFEDKLEELKETHKTPENFYSFMIMKSNFDEKYVTGLVRNTLENLDITTKKAQLLTFLALVNTYVAESHISLSLCEDFLQMKMVRWDDGVLDRMEPYANFLIEDSIEDWGGLKAIRILHPCIATACLEELGTYHDIKRSDITLNLLHCDLFFKTAVVKETFMKSVIRMLVERQPRTWGYGNTQFSPLIEDIHKQEGGERIEQIFIKASQRFEDRASIPQALARYLYQNEIDFPKALKYAEDAKRITENIYTVDTIGQVYKSELKHKMNNKKKICNPEDFRENLTLAEKAIKAFQGAQHLAKRQAEPDGDYEIHPSKRYNTSGHLGELETVLTVLEMISNLPFFDETDPQKKKYMQSFLKGVTRITSVPDIESEDNVKYFHVIQEYLRLLQDLNTHMKKIFEFFNCYFTYMKRESDAGDNLFRKQRKISEHFDRYIELMCSTPEEISQAQASKSALRLNSALETTRMFLEQRNADTFPGVLQFLDKSPEDFKKIAESYAFLHQYSQTNVKETTCFILANIILHCLMPNSTLMKNNKDLTDVLLALLQGIGLQYPFPEPYYVALLLLWPSTNTEDTNIVSYVDSLCRSSQKQLSHLLRKRRTVAHFYLGRRKGCVISKSQLDRCFSVMQYKALAQLWLNGDIFKEKEIQDRLQRVNGVLDAGVVYAIYGKNKIPVHPAYAGIRSGFTKEKVSFYLGFAINGPLAYDIQYEN